MTDKPLTTHKCTRASYKNDGYYCDACGKKVVLAEGGSGGVSSQTTIRPEQLPLYNMTRDGILLLAKGIFLIIILTGACVVEGLLLCLKP